MPGSSGRNRIAGRLAALMGVAVAGITVPAMTVPAASAADAWVWPVRGPVVTPYLNDNARPYAGGAHRGIDISASVGTTVGAARAGRVTYAGALGTSGLTVAVESADAGYVASYLHLSSIAVRRGESVRTGQKLGEVGTSGQRSAAQPHLHFGVRIAGRTRFYVDPLTLLPAPARGGSPATPAPVPARLRADAAPVPAGVRVAPVPSLPRPRAPPVSPPRWLPVPAGPARSSGKTRGSLRQVRPRAAEPGLRAGLDQEHALNWGQLVCAAGAALIAAVLAGRILPRDLGRRRSPAIRREHGTQPPARPAAVDVARLGSVSQMG